MRINFDDIWQKYERQKVDKKANLHEN